MIAKKLPELLRVFRKRRKRTKGVFGPTERRLRKRSQKVQKAGCLTETRFYLLIYQNPLTSSPIYLIPSTYLVTYLPRYA